MIISAAQIVLTMDGQEIAWFKNLMPSQIVAFREKYYNDDNIVMCLMPRQGYKQNNMPSFVAFLEYCLSVYCP